MKRSLVFLIAGLGTLVCEAAFLSPKDAEQQSSNGVRMTRTVAVQPPPPPTVTISWNYPTNLVTPDLMFKLRSFTNLTYKLSLWPVVTNIPGTNRSVKWPSIKPQEFFTLTASNYLGESGYATK